MRGFSRAPFMYWPLIGRSASFDSRDFEFSIYLRQTTLGLGLYVTVLIGCRPGSATVRVPPRQVQRTISSRSCLEYANWLPVQYPRASTITGEESMGLIRPHSTKVSRTPSIEDPSVG